jgi:hypothetical protein
MFAHPSSRVTLGSVRIVYTILKHNQHEIFLEYFFEVFVYYITKTTNFIA